MPERQTDSHDFDALFGYELEAVYDMEMKLVAALDELSALATNDNLSKGFAIHHTETERQVENVEAVFEAFGREPARRNNQVIDGLIVDRETFDDRVEDDVLRNTYYLIAAIKTERLEIASYEGLLLIANQAGIGTGVTDPLEQNLEQEKKTLRKLEGLAGESSSESLWKKVTDL